MNQIQIKFKLIFIKLLEYLLPFRVVRTTNFLILLNNPILWSVLPVCKIVSLRHCYCRQFQKFLANKLELLDVIPNFQQLIMPIPSALLTCTKLGSKQIFAYHFHILRVTYFINTSAKVQIEAHLISALLCLEKHQ